MRAHTAPLVGRQDELELLKRIYSRTVHDRTVQLVTIIGEPGVGKSRMVAELNSYIESLPDLITWRQGRCLSYGEGITFWALGEIVKAHAGILESDSPDLAASKLDRILPPGDKDREWFRQRLLPLLGLDASSPASMEESFTAWRRFLESIAEEGPVVFVFEDVHWADPSMLSFLEHTSEWSEGVPMLLVCTARPELVERHPDWGGLRRNASTIHLAPLTEVDTARLISALLDSAVLPAPVQTLILERAGGNPLYAEEFVRMLKDRELLVKKGKSWELVPGAEVPYPSSIQSLIAARLDTLPSGNKQMLQDASILGKVFWSGAVTEMGGADPKAVADALRDLSRKEILRAARVSSVEGDVEYAFWHALIRDVCYAQIPRAARATKHLAAASWIERVASGRVEDQAEILAHHYTTALELSRAAGQRNLGDLDALARRFLALAGDRALPLDVARAESSYRSALELAPQGQPERPDILVKWADALKERNHLPEASDAYEEAIEGLRGRGDVRQAAAAMGRLSVVVWRMGEPRHKDLAAQAVKLLESMPPGPELVASYAEAASASLVTGDNREVLGWAEKAIALAGSLELPVPARAVEFRGAARVSLGDAAGLTDLRRGLELALEQGLGREAANLYHNLGSSLWAIEGPGAALEVDRQGVAFSERRGLESTAVATACGILDQLVEIGSYDQALVEAAEVSSRVETAGDVLTDIQVGWTRVRVLARRGGFAEAARLSGPLVDGVREAGETQMIADAFSAAALAFLGLGQTEEALTLLRDVGGTPNACEVPWYAARLPEMVRTAIASGDPALAERLAAGIAPLLPVQAHALTSVRALLAERNGEHESAATLFEEAAGRWEGFGVVWERAQALLGHGRCLLSLARSTAAQVPLRLAREIFVGLGARPALAETDALLERAISLSS